MGPGQKKVGPVSDAFSQVESGRNKHVFDNLRKIDAEVYKIFKKNKKSIIYISI